MDFLQVKWEAARKKWEEVQVQDCSCHWLALFPKPLNVTLSASLERLRNPWYAFKKPGL